MTRLWAADFINEGQTIVVDKYKEVKQIIQAKNKTVTAAKCVQGQLATKGKKTKQRINYIN